MSIGSLLVLVSGGLLRSRFPELNKYLCLTAGRLKTGGSGKSIEFKWTK